MSSGENTGCRLGCLAMLGILFLISKLDLQKGSWLFTVLALTFFVIGWKLVSIAASGGSCGSSTKRPQNNCANCGYTWFPRGHNLSTKCPNCGAK